MGKQGGTCTIVTRWRPAWRGTGIATSLASLPRAEHFALKLYQMSLPESSRNERITASGSERVWPEAGAETESGSCIYQATIPDACWAACVLDVCRFLTRIHPSSQVANEGSAGERSAAQPGHANRGAILAEPWCGLQYQSGVSSRVDSKATNKGAACHRCLTNASDWLAGRGGRQRFFNQELTKADLRACQFV
jgi:hypothetical protein